MPEKIPQFDFSKKEDLKKSDNLPEEKRGEIVNEEREETKKIDERHKDLVNYLSSGDIYSAIKIKNKFNLPDELIQSNEVQQASKEGLVNCLLKGEIDSAIDIKDKFNLSKELIQSNEVQQASKEVFVNLLSNGFIYSAIKIKNKFNLPDELIQSNEVQQASKEVFVNLLSNGFIYSAIKIKNKFNLPDELIQSKEIQQASKKGLVNCLVKGEIDSAIDIKDKFLIDIQPREIIEKVPKIKDFLDKIKSVSLKFYEQAHKSTDLIIELFEFVDERDEFFEIAKENPFLVDAVIENSKFGSKLLLKYPQLDKLSQQNIKFLFDSKKEIIKENPNIDHQSFEFRQLTQEKLKNYEYNQDILKEIKRDGINIDKWLNYQGTSRFFLESGKSKLAFSETIATPINRIKETINSYTHQIKETLKEYKKELLEYQIPIEDRKDIEEKIDQMKEQQEKAREEVNEKKAQDIQKGIDNLNQKLIKIKSLSLWDKLLGDINGFSKLKDDVFGAQEKLIQAENKFAQKTSGKTPSGKEIQETKQKIAKVKEEFRVKFGLLENRIENFKTNLPNSIEPSLGKERTSALIQEIETTLAEQFDHYNTDRNDLANLFSEKSNKEKDKMESQPMRIFVWSRNPDIDLYQGNYSDCCIKINSEHMGAESTIADYNTDLGIQIVNIWDEAKNEPVTVAWCWLGKSEEKEKPVLVVDNIESNTVYSRNYSEQMKEELFDYLKNYAEAIGAEKVVLGKANNDLPTSGELNKMVDDSVEYEKIGGYNRAGGYFLEAEGESVKVIWKRNRK